MIATNFNFLCIDEYISENYSKCGLTENDLHKKKFHGTLEITRTPNIFAQAL